MINNNWYAGYMNETPPVSNNYNSLSKRHKSAPAKHLSSEAFYMYRRYLLQKAMSVFKWELPKSWDEDYFLYGLYAYGNLAQFNHAEYGNIIQTCGYQGYDIYYRPTEAIISNPAFPSPIEKKIAKEFDKTIDPNNSCVIWHLTPDYCGIMDLITYYAGLMANLSGAIDANAYNTRVAYIFTAQNKAMAESFKELFDQVSEGNPAVFADKRLFDDDGKPLYEMIGEDVKSFYIIDQLLLDLARIDDMFSQEVGIPNANTEKKERMITDEVNANNFETKSKCELWLDMLKKSEKLSEQVFGAENTPRVTWRAELQTVTPEASVNKGV